MLLSHFIDLCLVQKMHSLPQRPFSLLGDGMILREGMLHACAGPLTVMFWPVTRIPKRTVVHTIINNILGVLQQKQISLVIEICILLT